MLNGHEDTGRSLVLKRQSSNIEDKKPPQSTTERQQTREEREEDGEKTKDRINDGCMIAKALRTG